jgi:hypothetical protein
MNLLEAAYLLARPQPDLHLHRSKRTRREATRSDVCSRYSRTKKYVPPWGRILLEELNVAQLVSGCYK